MHCKGLRVDVVRQPVDVNAVESCADPHIRHHGQDDSHTSNAIFDLNQTAASIDLHITKRVPCTQNSNMTTEVADIAVVSFDKFINGDDADKRAVAQQIYNAFSTVGWVYLKNHGISQERVDETFTLVRTIATTSVLLPIAIGNKLTPIRPNHSSPSPSKRSVHGN
jgi:hypothetical protein